MSKATKLLEKFRQNPKNVRYEDFETLLLHLGFQKRRSAGSLVVFTYLGQAPLTIPINEPFLKAVYVKQVITLIDELNILEED